MRQGGVTMSAKRYRPNAVAHPHIPCPVCGGNVIVYTSRAVSRSTRELFFRCRDPECDASFRSLLEHANLIIDSRLPAEHPKRLPADADMPKLRQRAHTAPQADQRQLSFAEIAAPG